MLRFKACLVCNLDYCTDVDSHRLFCPEATGDRDRDSACFLIGLDDLDLRLIGCGIVISESLKTPPKVRQIFSPPTFRPDPPPVDK